MQRGADQSANEGVDQNHRVFCLLATDSTLRPIPTGSNDLYRFGTEFLPLA